VKATNKEKKKRRKERIAGKKDEKRNEG